MKIKEHTNKIILFTIISISNMSHAKECNQNQLKKIYKSIQSELSNDGDGVISKSDFVNCFELGINPPFKYNCSFDSSERRIIGSSAKCLFMSLSQESLSNVGDGAVSKTGNVYCSEIGLDKPFKYSCFISP